MAPSQHDANERRVGELLAAVIANAVAVPAVVGFVALGAATIVGRSLVELASHRLRRRATTGPTGRTTKRRPKASGRKVRTESDSARP